MGSHIHNRESYSRRLHEVLCFLEEKAALGTAARVATGVGLNSGSGLSNSSFPVDLYFDVRVENCPSPLLPMFVAVPGGGQEGSVMAAASFCLA